MLIDPNELRKIGFNGTVGTEAQRIMVQTEVLGRGHLVIRTLVLQHGVVRSSEEQPCPVTTDLEVVRRTAREQHDRILERERHQV